ncbi:MAG: methyltransferase [Ginsengibacter sp.]
MSNDYFQFKQFTIQQEECGMKVCTDSCLFGAWIAHKVGEENIKPKNILDIGTGTGLLSLMLAQKCSAQIDGIDVDSNSFTQATENFNASPWNERLHAFHSNINEWKPSGKYDLIISNPPFYENDLLPGDYGKSISKHSSLMRLEDLLLKAKDLLNEDGTFAVLLPWRRTLWFENAAANHSLLVKEKMEVKQTPAHSYFRTMALLQHQKNDIVKTDMAIKTSQNEYTAGFSELLKDYYLYL